MYINKDDAKNHAKNILSRHLEKEEGDIAPKIQNTGYKKYGVFWMTAISVDIRSFKVMVDSLYKSNMIKLIQAFTSTLIKMMKKNNNFRSTYVNGDEVIGVFAADTKEKITDNLKTAILCNSFVNYLFPKILKEQKYNIEFKAGIGVWTSNDNSIIRYGEQYSVDSHSTVIGSVINWASYLAKIANKSTSNQIAFNEITKNNVKIEKYKNDANYISSINNSRIYGFSYRFTEYAE